MLEAGRLHTLSSDPEEHRTNKGQPEKYSRDAQEKQGVLVQNQGERHVHKDFLEDPHLLVEYMIFTESRIVSGPSLGAIGLSHEGCFTRPL